MSLYARPIAALLTVLTTVTVAVAAPVIEHHPFLGLASPNPGAVSGRRASVPAGPVLGPRTPGLSTNFEGLTYTGFFPPDPVLAAGPTEIVAVVNGGIALFSKTGTKMVERTLNDFFNGALSSGPKGGFCFDPRVIRDPHSGRFFVSAADGETSTSPDSWLRIAVSKTDGPANLNVGPTAGDDWWGYDIDADLDGGMQVNDNGADFPAIGVDENNLYVTANMFDNMGAFMYPKVWIIPKAALLTNGALTTFEFGAPPGPALSNPTTTFTDFSIAPAINFDPGTEHMLATNALDGSGTTGFVTFWTVNDPTGTPTLLPVNLSVAGWNDFSLPDCMALGAAPAIDTGDTRMLGVVERNGSIWATHTQPNAASSAVRTEARWYEIDPTGPTVVQFGQVADPSRCYFYPAIQPDAAGNVTLVMAGVDPTIFGSAFYTGRNASDATGTMQRVTALKNGLASYAIVDSSTGENRWGDYSGISIDPSTGEMWMVGEFAATQTKWSTWIGKAEAGTGATTTTTTTTLPPGDPIRGRRLVLRDRVGNARARRLVFTTRDSALDPTVLDPTAADTTLHVFNSAGGMDSVCLDLSPDHWRRRRGSFRYRDNAGTVGPVRQAILRRGFFRAQAAGSQLSYTLDEASQGSVGVTLAVGSTRLCTNFGGNVRADKGGLAVDRFVAVSAPAPASCPVPPATCP
jgi:hypothetical protein